MIIEIGSHRFPGFYESIFCNSDEFIDDEAEVEAELKDYFHKEFEVYYEYDDFEEYKRDVSKQYLECFVEKLIELLPSDIADNNNFQFKIIEDEDNITVISPKYYNYTTDSCYCLVETNKQTLQMLKDFGLKHSDTQQYLIDHFTSYDGFMSFIKNDIEYWKQMDIEEYIEEERYLIALLDMIIALNDSNGFDEIRLDTYYQIDKYYYAGPVVYCTEKDKKEIEKEFPLLTIKTVE